MNLTANFSTLWSVLQVCQANELFTVELARRLHAPDQPSDVTIACLKIGVVKTNIRRGFPGWMKPLVPLVFDPLLGQTAQEAAEAALVLLRDEALEGRTGGLFLKIGKLEQVLATGRFAPEEARRLWDLSQRLTARSPPPASAPSWQTPATDPSFPGGNSILAPR